MKKAGFWLLMLILLCVFSGCQPQRQMAINGKLVTQIVVTSEDHAQFTRRFYNTNEKMQLILLYIRSLGPRFTPEEDPESLPGRIICITMRCADGSQKIYRQKDTLYFQEGNSPWMQMDPERGSQLHRILVHTPSDPEPEPLEHMCLPRIAGPWQDRQAIWRIHR